MISRVKGSVSSSLSSLQVPALAQAVTAFLLDRRISGATDATIDTYRLQLRTFLEWCGGLSLDLSAVRTDHLRTYLGSRQKLSQSALFEAARRLKTFFRWCAQEGVCVDLASTIRRPKTEQKVIQPLSVSQVKAMLALCRGDSFVRWRDGALLRLLLDSGLRIGETLALTPSDVDIENRRVLIQHGKGQKQRMVPMGPRTARAILSYTRLRNQITASSTKLFLVEGGNPMKRRHAHQQIARIAKRAGIEEPVGPHRLRHTCALWFLRRGGDAFSLQQLLGHATLEMTKRYVSMTVADISEAHAKFAPGDIV